MPTDFAFRHRLDVRFRDCDAMGHVNNAVYLTYMEETRLAFWRSLTGTSLGRPTPGRKAGIIIARVECDFRRPAFVSEGLEIRLNVAEIGRSSFAFVYELVNVATGQRVADGKTVQVAFDYEQGRATPIPPDTRALLEAARIG